jgi:hypothetical protein
MCGLLALALAALLSSAALAAAADLAVPVHNPSFEDVTADGRPVAWDADPSVYQVDDQVAHTGRRSLRFVNMDANRYVLCGLRIALKPGCLYEFSVWVKTKGLQGEDSGATMCLEWSDEDGKYWSEPRILVHLQCEFPRLARAQPAILEPDTFYTPRLSLLCQAALLRADQDIR